MIVFLLFFLTLYGGVNAYFFWKVHQVLPAHWGWTAGLGAFCLLMVAAPILVRALEHQGHIMPAAVSAAVGHNWMALVFWFLVLGAAVDAWNFALRLAGRYAPFASDLALRPRAAVPAIGILVIAAALWGLYEAGAIRIKEVRLKMPMPPNTPPMRIAVISDVHLSLTLGEGRLRRIVGLIEQAKPDILISAGDILDSTYHQLKPLAPMLRGAHSPKGKFAVMGNHEFYAGPEHSVAFIEDAGFRLLRQESALIDGWLRIVGVDDPSGRRVEGRKPVDEAALLSANDGSVCTVLIRHRPDVNRAVLDKFHLQISGHTHGGQIFPFNFITHLFYPVGVGLQRVNGATVYISRGTGTWGPRMRLLSPPEVTLIILEP